MTEFLSLVSLTRRMVLLASLFVAGCGALWAQPDGPMGPPPGGMQPSLQERFQSPSVERQLKRLTQLLTLTEAQQAQVRAILTDQRQQVEALIKPAKASAGAIEDQQPDMQTMEALRAAVASIRAEARGKIAALLTDSQRTTYAAWESKREKAAAKQEQSEDMPPPPPDGGDGPPPDGGGGPGGGPPGGGPPGV